MGSQELLPFLSETTPAGLLGLGILLLMFGWLVPRSVLRARLADKDAIIAEQRGYIQALERNNMLLRRGNEATVSVVRATTEAIRANGE